MQLSETKDRELAKNCFMLKTSRTISGDTKMGKCSDNPFDLMFDIEMVNSSTVYSEF